MERRKHPRVQLPLEVRLTHPFVGQRTVVAKDLSDEGIYVWYADAPFKVGSSMEVTLLGNPMIESQPTPTVRMTVSRLDETGLALSFVNKSGAHLWRSAGLRATELHVGQDLFRVFQAAVVRDGAGRILTVQQHGRWLFPGQFLRTDVSWEVSLQEHLSGVLHLTDTAFVRTVLTHNDPESVARESAIMSLFHLFEVSTEPAAAARAQLADDAPYTKVRWIDTPRTLDELSFSAEPLRELVRGLLRNQGNQNPLRALDASPQEVHLKHG